MFSTDLVSVIVPCFNGAKYIESTIRSVLAQTHKYIQVIVVDDKSTDSSVSIVRALAHEDDRIKLIELQRNHGAPAAPRNEGVRLATGDWIAFLDADDLWHPKKLEYQLNALNQYDALACSTMMRDLALNQSFEFLEPGKIHVQKITFLKQLVKYRTPTSSIIVKRDLMINCPFKEDLQFKAREDTDCFTRIHEYIPYSIKLMHPFILYRLQENQISGNKWKMVPRHLNMLKKYQLRSGKSLGFLVYIFTFTHFFLSMYYRVFRKVL